MSQRACGWPRRRTTSKAVLAAVVVAALGVLTACSTHSPAGGNGAPSATGAPGASSSGATQNGSANTESSTQATGAAVVSIGPQRAGGISPTTPIVVRAAKGTLTSVAVTNAAGRHVSGSYNPTMTSWSSNVALGYGKTYHVTADAKSTEGAGVAHQTGEVKVIKPSKVAFASFAPPPSVPDFGVGQPLQVIFQYAPKDKLAAQKTLSVNTVPAQQGAWYWLSDRQVDYRPKAFWKAGTKITLAARGYGMDLGGGVWGDDDRTASYTVHDSWIGVANGANEHMAIYHNGQEVKTMAISMGKHATPTHEGVHVVSAKSQEYTMNSCSYGVCSGPGAYIAKEYWAERISDDGEFVHENPESIADQGSSNVSHGCINLNEQDAKWFFAHFGLGDVVKAENSGGGPLPLGDNVGDWSVPWAQWSAGNAS